jgi:hypothetical protein
MNSVPHPFSFSLAQGWETKEEKSLRSSPSIGKNAEDSLAGLGAVNGLRIASRLREMGMKLRLSAGQDHDVQGAFLPFRERRALHL